MEDIKLLRNDFGHFMELNELQHNMIINKLNTLEEKITTKYLNSDRKIEKIEKETDSLKQWKIYTIALATLICILLPQLFKFFG